MEDEQQQSDQSIIDCQNCGWEWDFNNEKICPLCRHPLGRKVPSTAVRSDKPLNLPHLKVKQVDLPR